MLIWLFMKLVINACNFTAILFWKLVLVLRGLEVALEKLLKFCKKHFYIIA